MTTLLLIAMALLLIAALERTNRRQAPKAPGLNGSYDRDDRDWARTKLDLLALGSQGEPSNHHYDDAIGRTTRKRSPANGHGGLRSWDRHRRPASTAGNHGRVARPR